LGKVVELEHPELRASVIDLDPAGAAVGARIAREVLSDGAEREVAYRGGERRVARLVRTRATAADAAEELVLVRPGSPDGLQFRPLSRRPPGRGEVEICVAATGLNFRDVLITLGMYPDPDAPLGGECAGWISAVGEGLEDFAVGDAVMALASRSFATYVIADAHLVFALPRRLDFAQGATILSAFMTAQHALCLLAGMKSGDRVLIHSAAGVSARRPCNWRAGPGRRSSPRRAARRSARFSGPKESTTSWIHGRPRSSRRFAPPPAGAASTSC
jgi:hypothetical protein